MSSSIISKKTTKEASSTFFFSHTGSLLHALHDLRAIYTAFEVESYYRLVVEPTLFEKNNVFGEISVSAYITVRNFDGHLNLHPSTSIQLQKNFKPKFPVITPKPVILNVVNPLPRLAVQILEDYQMANHSELAFWDVAPIAIVSKFFMLRKKRA